MAIDTKVLRELHAKATPGEWEAEGDVVWAGDLFVLETWSGARDAPAIAATHNHLPALLDENDRLREALERIAAQSCEVESEMELHEADNPEPCSTVFRNDPDIWCNPCRARRALGRE